MTIRFVNAGGALRPYAIDVFANYLLNLVHSSECMIVIPRCNVLYTNHAYTCSYDASYLHRLLKLLDNLWTSSLFLQYQAKMLHWRDRVSWRFSHHKAKISNMTLSIRPQKCAQHTTDDGAAERLRHSNLWLAEQLSTPAMSKIVTALDATPIRLGRLIGKLMVSF